MATGGTSVGQSNKLQILCLHGHAQTAEKFRVRIGSLRGPLKKHAEFHFVEGPYAVPACEFSDEPAASWIENWAEYRKVQERLQERQAKLEASVLADGASGAPPDVHAVPLGAGRPAQEVASSPASVAPMIVPSVVPAPSSGVVPVPAAADEEEDPSLIVRYRGLEKTFALLRDWIMDKRIDGLFGFSQGAAMIAMLLAQEVLDHGPASDILRQIRFVTFFAGFLPRDPEQASRVRAAFARPAAPGAPPLARLPSYHCFGETDAIISPARARDLIDLFEEPVVFSHPGGHLVPSQAKPTLVDFVGREVARKREGGPVSGGQADEGESQFQADGGRV